MLFRSRYTLLKNNNIYHRQHSETIIWKICNRGKEASLAKQLEFECESFKNKSVMEIDTEYLGHHYVECIIKKQFGDNIKLKFGIYIR